MHISLLAWSFSLLGILHNPLLAAIASQAIRPLSQATIIDIVNTAWAFARRAILHWPLLQALAAAALALRSDLEVPHLANMAWSYARLGCQHRPLLHALSSASINRITEASTHALAKTSWAMENSCLADTHHAFLRMALEVCIGQPSLACAGSISGSEYEDSLSAIDMANSMLYGDRVARQCPRAQSGTALQRQRFPSTGHAACLACVSGRAACSSLGTHA